MEPIEEEVKNQAKGEEVKRKKKGGSKFEKVGGQNLKTRGRDLKEKKEVELKIY